ncbi:MAG: dTDP-4-dehydrorhamnose reductase [Bacteroidetes bacterium]|nr:dTDP-4-dehydrorhamnose reductase [Bacteroidota bacterium]
MTERILLFGRGGQVGTEARPLFERLGEVVALDHDDVDLRNVDALRETIRSIRPTILVNAAAYTAVDKAESEPETARAINAAAPATMAEEAARLGAQMVHYSTDYVYPGDGTRPYREDDPTGPLGVYGQTKLDGDLAVLEALPEAVILRTSWVFSPHGHNFVKTMLRLADEGRTHLRVVADQRGTPTSAALLAAGAVGAVEHRIPGGVYHLTNAGETTWHGFAEAIFAERARLLPHAAPVTVEPIATADYPTPARRPAYSVLDNAKWDALGATRGLAWEDESLKDVVERISGSRLAVR